VFVGKWLFFSAAKVPPAAQTDAENALFPQGFF
jgi:hypothetical protein